MAKRYKLKNPFYVAQKPQISGAAAVFCVELLSLLSVSSGLQFEELGIASGFAQEFVVAALFQDLARF